MNDPTPPLEGISVLDLTSVIMGPLATQMLGDLGADVITVETPSKATNRAMTPGPKPGLSGVAMNLMRNKRSVILDLATERGRAVARSLAARCDVVVTSLRPGSLRRLGLDYQSIVAAHPGVVYCQAQGYPSESPQADEPAYDDVIQAAGGVADLGVRVDGVPALVPTVLADKVSGLVISQAVLAALIRRARTGMGAHIEVPMSEVMASFVLVEHGGAAMSEPPQGSAGYRRILAPSRRPAATKDGWVHVLPYTRRNYDDLFTAGGRTELVGDQRVASISSRVEHADELYRAVASILATRTTDEWLEFCSERQIPASAVRTLDELISAQPVEQHPTAGDYHVIRPFGRFDGRTEFRVRRHAPTQGQHTREVLAEAGFADVEIDDLVTSGVALEMPLRKERGGASR